MNVRFSDSSVAPSPAPSAARLVALKQQIRARNPGLLSSSRSLRRRRSLLLLHQQQMELMTPESFDPFTESSAEEAAAASSHAKHSHRRDRSDRGEELAGRAAGGLTRAHSHSRNASMAAKPGSLSGGLSARAGALTRHPVLARQAAVAKADSETATQLRLSRAEMRQLLSQLQTQHPALLSATEEEEKEQERPAARSGDPAAAARSASSSVSAAAAAGSPVVPPASPSTPRLSFSQKRVDKFDESVKVMMSFSHADMELIRTSILQRGGGVTRQQFLAIAVKKQAGDDGYEREVEALAEMFEEIDVNGDGELQYGEFTSYLVELANGRYDHHHIDQLLHTDYRGQEPVSNDDRIDVLSISWYAALGQFVMLEKGQSRFKLLDARRKTVRVVRGHAGEILCSEWLPLHGLLVTAARDRTLRFWAQGDGDSGKAARDSSNGLGDGHKESRTTAAAGLPRKSSHASFSSSSSSPGFQCLSVWPLPSPQVCLCWSKSRLYSADILGRLLVWNIDVGEIKTSLQAHEGRVTALAAMQEEGCIASAGMDGAVRVWDCSDLRCLASWQHDGAVRSLCWDAERRLLLSGGDDECLRVWSAETKQQLRLLNFREEDEKEARRRDGPLKVDGKKEGAAAGAGKRKDAEAAAGGAGDVGLSGDSVVGMVVTGCEALVVSQCGLIRVLDLRKWTVEQTLALPRVWDDRSRGDEEEDEDEDEQQEEAKETAALRSRQLVTSHTVYSPAARSPLPSSSPSSSEQQELVVSAGSSLYSFTRNSAVNHRIADSHPILSALYVSGSFTILTASHRSLKVWDCITGRLLKEFHDIVPRGTVVSSVCVDGRGRKVIVGGSDGRVVVFNCNTGAQMQQLSPVHDADVLCLSYLGEQQAAGREEEEEEGEGKARPALPAASGGEGEGVSKVLCSARHGVFIHHDDHEAALANSGYTSLYHSCFHHRADITALIASQRFAVIASASADESVILYPANLDGTPLQRIHLGSRVEALLFLHPFRLLLAASGGGRLSVHCFSNEQHELIGHWRSGEAEEGGEAGEGGQGGGESGAVQHLAMDAATETLYTGDDTGCVTAWPLSEALFSPFRALLADQQLSLSSHQLPDPQALLRFFPRGLQAVKRSLQVRAHRGAVTGLSVVPGRDRAWSAEAMAAAEARERDVQREEEEWKEQTKEAYENAAYRTAQLLYEGGTTAASASAQRLSASASAPSGSSLSISELLSLLTPEQLAQLDKEKRRIARQLQHDLSAHFTARREQNAALLSSHLRSLDLQHGSATAVLSSGADGCVHLHSVEDGSCLGSLHQGEVATLGLGTPAQWKYHVNMEERKRTDRQRLSQCVQEMEQERALWQRGEQQRREEEAIAARLREEERAAAREEDDDPNDLLPFERAATTEQKQLMDRVEERITQTISSPAFQAKIRPGQHRDGREAARGAKALPPSLPAAAASRVLPVHVSAASGLPGLTRLSAVPSSALLPLASPSGQQHRSVASQQLEADYSRGLTQRRSRDRAQPPPLQLSHAQQMKAAIARAVPLQKKQQASEEESEESTAAAAALADSRKTKAAAVRAAAHGGEEEVSAAMKAAMAAVNDKRLLLKAIAKTVRQPAGRSAAKPVSAAAL